MIVADEVWAPSPRKLLSVGSIPVPVRIVSAAAGVSPLGCQSRVFGPAAVAVLPPPRAGRVSRLASRSAKLRPALAPPSYRGGFGSRLVQRETIPSTPSIPSTPPATMGGLGGVDKKFADVDKCSGAMCALLSASGIASNAGQVCEGCPQRA